MYIIFYTFIVGKGVIITKFKQKAGGGRASRDQGKDKRDSDALACMRVWDAPSSFSTLSTFYYVVYVSSLSLSDPPIPWYVYCVVLPVAITVMSGVRWEWWGGTEHEQGHNHPTEGERHHHTVPSCHRSTHSKHSERWLYYHGTLPYNSTFWRTAKTV